MTHFFPRPFKSNSAEKSIRKGDLPPIALFPACNRIIIFYLDLVRAAFESVPPSTFSTMKVTIAQVITMLFLPQQVISAFSPSNRKSIATKSVVELGAAFAPSHKDNRKDRMPNIFDALWHNSKKKTACSFKSEPVVIDPDFTLTWWFLAAGVGIYFQNIGEKVHTSEFMILCSRSIIWYIHRGILFLPLSWYEYHCYTYTFSDFLFSISQIPLSSVHQLGPFP